MRSTCDKLRRGNESSSLNFLTGAFLWVPKKLNVRQEVVNSVKVRNFRINEKGTQSVVP